MTPMTPMTPVTTETQRSVPTARTTTAILDRTLVGIWAALVVATGISVALHEGLAGGVVAIGAVVAIAFVKVWLVGRWFMELRDAPAVLRSLFDAYAMIVPLVLLGILLAA